MSNVQPTRHIRPHLISVRAAFTGIFHDTHLQPSMLTASHDPVPGPSHLRIRASSEKVGAWLDAHAVQADRTQDVHFQRSFQHIKPKRPFRSMEGDVEFRTADDEDTFRIHQEKERRPSMLPPHRASQHASADAVSAANPQDASDAMDRQQGDETAPPTCRQLPAAEKSSLRRASSLFALPAQRTSTTAGIASYGSTDGSTKRLQLPQKRAMSVITETGHEAERASSAAEATLPHIPEQANTIKKEPRRRTIFVPSEDTTIMTIHPGHAGSSRAANAQKPRRPRRSDVFLEIAEDEAESTTTTTTTTQVRPPVRRPRSSLAGAPRRAALGNITAKTNLTPVAEDVTGSGPGKENLRPEYGDVKRLGKKRASILLPHKSFETDAKRHVVPSPIRDWEPKPASRQAEPSATLHRARLEETNPGGGVTYMRSLSDLHSTTGPPLRRASVARQRVNKPASRQSFLPQLPEVLATPAVPCLDKKAPVTPTFTVIPEDVEDADMYEENWISHQETAMSQLMNSLFESVGHASAATDLGSKGLRQALLDMHQDGESVLLHKRLQASLQFGALAISQDALQHVSRLNDDLGQRQRFLDLWLKTYDLAALQACAEVVVGREIATAPPTGDDSSPASKSSPQRLRASRKVIATFLKTFLIGTAAAAPARRSTMLAATLQPHHSAAHESSSAAVLWRRTVLRSLMLVLLLDRAKGAGLVPGCLFQSSSVCKSSAAVLQALSKILLPSIGDIGRVLGHLNYAVSQIQYPLQEFVYRVDNLATDLRDGVRLTRLAETLLYPLPSLALQEHQDITFTLPTGDVLTCTLDAAQHTQLHPHSQSWVLSQHLKYPCVARAQKVFNVQIALSALSAAPEIQPLLASVTAEDIVDGHREKTVGLLWALLSRWGLEALVDFPLLEREIARLNKEWNRLCERTRNLRCPPDHAVSSADPPTELAGAAAARKPQSILKHWAAVVARAHGGHVDNLSTAFADGSVFASILSTYSAFALPHPDASAPRKDLTVPQTLAQLGCSKAFIALFPIPADARTNWARSIPTSTTVLPLLAFLASRLVPASVPHTAAARIQRAWRTRRMGFELRRRVVCKVLARDCANVVVFRERIEHAAVTIQRVWRARERRLLGRGPSV